MGNVSQTAHDKRPVMWEDHTLKGPDFAAVATLLAKTGDYTAILHLGASHTRVRLYTRRPEEAKRRTEVLYDMAITAVEEIAKSAETGFHLQSELGPNDSHDA